jgi:hypothetical protein
MHNVCGRIVDGFLSRVGFVFAMITVPLVIIHPILAAISRSPSWARGSAGVVSLLFSRVSTPTSTPRRNETPPESETTRAPIASPRNRHTVTPYSWGHAAP